MKKKNKKAAPAPKPFLALSRKAIAGWLAAIFIACGWMFAIGVLVGRGTSPLKIDINELHKKLEAAKQKLKLKEQRQTPKNSGAVANNPNLGFYEALPKNREDTEIFQQPPPPVTEKKIDRPPAKKPAHKKKESKKRLTKVQPKQGPKTLPSTAKPYTIQVAAFKTAQEADQLVSKLKGKGFAAYRAIGKVPGQGIWFRVRVGAYDNRSEAQKTLSNLKKRGINPVIVEK